jgi:hypothetical protein
VWLILSIILFGFPIFWLWCTWWRLFEKHVERTQLNIYVLLYCTIMLLRSILYFIIKYNLKTRHEKKAKTRACIMRWHTLLLLVKFWGHAINCLPHVSKIPILTYKWARRCFRESRVLILDFGEVYSIQHYVIKFSVSCDRSVVLSGYSGFLHQ